MIDDYQRRVEGRFRASPLVVSHDVRLRTLAPTVHLLECHARWSDGSRLTGVEVLQEVPGEILRLKYRWQYLDAKESHVFRYDNAPHHRALAGFPDHKHTAVGVEPAKPPSPEEIISEVEQYILRHQTT